MKRRVTVKSSMYVVLIVAFLLCAAIIKLLYVAVANNVDGVNLKQFADSRNTKTKTLYASRGSIYDAAGDALALSVNSYTLIAYLSESRTTNDADPQHVVDKEYTAKMLAPILGIEESKILDYLSQEGKYQVEFGSKGRNLTEIVKKQIDDLELPGIDFTESTQRYYKMGNFASYIIGYAKTNDDGDIVGELGLESYFNDALSGKDGFITYQSDAYGYQLPNVPSVTDEAVSGSDIYLTIDSSIQLIAENAIHDLDEAYDFDFAIMTIMDAKTGAIIASSTSPSYNPNDLNTLTSYLNPLVSYSYEPGSTMKIFSWASAMEEGYYNPEDTFMSGSIEVADVIISDANKKGWGEISYDRGFAMSSNVGATNLVLNENMGGPKLESYYRKYGFGVPTGIELSGELSGDLSFKYKSEIASASFGQGITITPIQMLQALTALTNDGVMLKPYVVNKIVDGKGDVTYEGGKTIIGQVMKASTAQKMRELMYVANYDGLSKMWQPKTVNMLAKTGTAQIASPNGGYLKGQYDYIYSVAGIFPEDNPRYIIYTAVKKIVGSQRNVADMVTKAVDEIASYANITKTENETYKENIITLDNYSSKKTEEVKTLLEEKRLNVTILGTGEYVTSHYPSKGTKVVSGSRVFILTNNNDVIMPDITGWSLSEVKTLAKLLNLKISYTGYGYVTSQSIEVGTSLEGITQLQITLENKNVRNVDL
ncbi:MAG: penicillin-binding protein [Firmicutes bacterium]|nr:penicillin-binding protein [Bacillota bacterium]